MRFFSNILLKIAGLSYHSPIIPMLRSQRQEDLEFEASLNYLATPQSEAKQISLFLCCEPGCLHLPCITFLLLHPPFLGINQRAAAESCPESLTCFLLPGLHQTSQTDKRDHSAAGNLGVFSLNSEMPLISHIWPMRLTWGPYTHSVHTDLCSSIVARLTPTVLPWFRYPVIVLPAEPNEVGLSPVPSFPNSA